MKHPGQGLTRGWLLAAILFCIPVFVLASPQVEEKLVQAEGMRSSEPVRLRHLLGELRDMEGQATPLQNARIRYLHAYAKAYAGEYDEAIGEARKLLAEADDVDVKVRAGGLIVNSHAATRNFAEGLRQLESTLQLVPGVKSDDVRWHIWVAAAVLYNQIGQYELGLEFSRKLEASPIKPRTKCFAGQLRLEALLNISGLPEKDSEITEVIDYCVEQKELVVANLTRILLARKWAAEGDRRKAIALLRRHLGEAEETRYPRLSVEMHGLLAQYLLEEQQIAAAEAHARRVTREASGIAFTLPLAMAHKTLYQIAERRNDVGAMLQHYRNYAEADKAYLNDVKAREMAYQIVRQETLQKSQQINQLDQKNQLLQLQSRLDQQSAQNTRLVVLLLVVLIASIGYWAFKVKRVQLSLKKLAETDALTGVCNRHNFTLRAEHSLAQCARAGEEAALVMFDLDHFKQINDRHGHQTGDWALKQVTQACQNFCRRIDALGRLGGEEFAFLLHGCDMRNARRMAEDCRMRIAGIDTRETGFDFPITASFGVTTTAVSGYSLAKLLSHADKALYRAKHLGRNRVCGTDDEPMVSVLGEAGEIPAVLAEDAALDGDYRAARLERAC